MSKERIEVQSVDLKPGSTFMANGKKYYVSEKISIARFKEYEKLEPLLTYGVGFKEIFDGLKKNYQALNEKRFADAAVITHNIMTGIKDIENDKRVHPALLMAALVINREDENPKIFDRQIQEDKIKDWTEEGLNIIDFFTLSLTSIRGFRETYLEFIRQQAKDIVEKSELTKTS